MRVGSLFAGIGGFDLTAERAGMTIVWQSEIDQHASRVLAHHWPTIPNLGDVHEITRPPTVDVLCGGFPCQDYSVAGKRGGLAADRGALWWEFHRLIDECRPTWIVGENVPGLLSSRDGRDFATIIDSLVELGYGVVWRVLDAQWFGVAQRRRRIFIVGHFGGEPRPEILALGQSVCGDSPPSRETGPGTAAGVSTSLKASGKIDHVGDESKPITARPYKSPNLEGSEDAWVAFNWQSGQDQLSARTSHTDALHAGQVPAVAFAQNQRDELRVLDQAGALAAEPGMKQQTYILDVSRRDRVGVEEGDVAPTLQQQMGTGGNNTPMVASSSVRRLTPLECERLQGFPDGWTDIPGNSDTQRYRQLGNAVAVPVVEWIMQRIGADT